MDQTAPQDTLKGWSLVMLVSLVFLVATGAVWSSLGILLPSMIEELEWSWSQAGLGFTIIGLMTGLSSTLPAWVMQLSNTFGVKLCYIIGGLIGAAGFATFANAQSIWHFYLGATLIGTGYSFAGVVPGVKVVSDWITARRSVAVGLFFFSGAVGSILGPIATTSVQTVMESWRAYWAIVAGLMLVLGIVAGLAIPRQAMSETEGEAATDSGAANDDDWALGEAMRTPQFYIIAGGLTAGLLAAITMNTWQFTHMSNLGVSAQIAAGALSAQAVFNALARGVGGVVADWIGAKWLFVSGLITGVIGMFALGFADTPFLIATYAIADGYSFGIIVFSSTLLLLNYYGTSHNPAILGTVNLITTAAMIGPAMGGVIAGAVGSFMPVFVGISGILLIAFCAALPMKKPVRQSTADTPKSETVSEAA